MNEMINTEKLDATTELPFPDEGVSTVEINMDAKADAVAGFPFVAALGTLLTGLLFLFVAVLSFIRYGFDVYLLLAVPMGLLGMALCSLCVYFVWSDREPLDEKGIEVMRDFPFNKPGEEFLRGVVVNRGSVRTIDLRKALKRHRQHETTLKNAQLDQFRHEVQQKFSSQS